MRIFLLGLISTLLSCSYSDRNIAKMAANDLELKYAQAITSSIVEKSFSEIEPYVTPELSEKSFLDNVDKMAASVPTMPVTIEVFQVTTTNLDNLLTKEIRFELTFSNDQRNILNLYTRGKAEAEKIVGFHFQDGAVIKNLTSFKLNDKPFTNYVFLILSVAAQLVVIIAAIGCLLLRPKRWLVWLIFISFGLILFELNWATNHIDIQPLRATMLAGYISKKGLEYSPWFIGFALPIGAIIFLKLYGKQVAVKIKRQA